MPSSKFKPGDKVVVVREDPDGQYGSGSGVCHHVGDKGVVVHEYGGSIFGLNGLAVRVRFPKRGRTWWAYEHELRKDGGLLDI